MSKDVKAFVKERYGKIARGEQTFCCPSCGPSVTGQSIAVGYSPEELKAIPQEAILGVGCGNPTALADLKPGETVLDLGSGAGIDVFLAAKKVGERGRVIGVDMTEDMIARGNALAAKHGYRNVEFRLGEIEHLPLDSDSVDIIISNCVINLTPDKVASYREAWRVLKPGGRILISDLVTAGELPEDVRRSVAEWANCIAGAMEREAYLAAIREAGFGEVAVVSECPYEFAGMDERLKGRIISVKVRALKKAGLEPRAVKEAVRERYAKIARGEATCCGGSCGLNSVEQARKMGYSDEELASVPPLSILGLGCGNPLALADPREGEVVLDLGSGAGIDAFLAAKKVGPKGKVIGVDMVEEMVAKGLDLAASGGYSNIEFRLGEIERLPVESASVDLIISNCVINLCPDKPAAYREAHRVLKPGGRMLISDLVTTGPLPADLQDNLNAWADCTGGVLPRGEYLAAIEEAGFGEVEVVAENVHSKPWHDPRLAGKLVSLKIKAVKQERKESPMSKTVSVKVLDLPGGGGGCCTCGGGCGPDYGAQLQQKVNELRAALEAEFPGRASVEYVDLRQDAAAKESEAGQLLVTKKYPSPLVLINGEARFAGSIMVKKIAKAVGDILG